MTFLLDTDVVIDLLNDNPDATELLPRLSRDGISMSVISYMESYEGLFASPNPEVLISRFDQFVAEVPVLLVSEVTARHCALMRIALRRRGKRVRPRALDLLIAATAIEHNLTLVTRNQADYADISGLMLFNDF